MTTISTIADRFNSSAIADSDKNFWHRYTETYLRAFSRLGGAKKVVEFGLFKGASVRWLAEVFPDAQIFGFDILPIQDEWPRSDRIHYGQMDQEDRGAIARCLQEAGDGIDLIIEDGSHIPQHQASCLAEGLKKLRVGGLYVLEDLATSHPANKHFAHYSKNGSGHLPNALNVLLAIRHIKETHRPIQTYLDRLSAEGFFTREDISSIHELAVEIDIYKRTALPLICHSCRNSEFDYANLTCVCGTPLYEEADSMSGLIWRG